MTDTNAVIAAARPGTRLRLYLERTRFAEMPSYWPWVAGKRVRRVLKVLPLLYIGDPFDPRRSSAAPPRPRPSLLCALGLHAVRRDLSGEFRPCSDCGWEAGR